MSNVWSVRGVSPELRKKIVSAANRSGLTVAEWLDQAVSPSLEGRQPNPLTPATRPEGDAATDDPQEIVAAIDACLLDLAMLTDLRGVRQSN